MIRIDRKSANIVGYFRNRGVSAGAYNMGQFIQPAGYMLFVLKTRELSDCGWSRNKFFIDKIN